VVPAG